MIKKQLLILCIFIYMLCGTACQEPQDIEFVMPDTTTETPEATPEETPEQESDDMGKDKTPTEATENTTPTATIITTTARVINASIQNELKAKERLTISIPKSELQAPAEWSTIKIQDIETEKQLYSERFLFFGRSETVDFIADNDRHIGKSFDACIQFFDSESNLVQSEEVTIYTPIKRFAAYWQNREGKIDQGFILLEDGKVKYTSTVNDRTGASDCAMRLVLRVPDGESAVVSVTAASVCGGGKPMLFHFRGSDYNLKYRQAMYPAPDDPAFHYDTENDEYVFPVEKESGLHIIHVCPNSPDFDDTELIMTIERTTSNGEKMSYGVSCYFVPENIELLRSVMSMTSEVSE